MAEALSGKVSWFGGPNDPTDTGHTASGGTTKEPGIAVYNRATLGGYWRVTGNNGKSAVLRQTDLGPAPWTGRKIDVTYSALNRFGYNEHNFPTDSQFKAEYLGKDARAAQKAATAPESPSKSLPGVRTIPGTTQAAFNAEGFQKALQKAQNNRLLLSLPGGKELEGLFNTKSPLRSEYAGTATTPSKTEVLKGPGSGGIVPPGHELHGLLPLGAKVLEWNRKDQGHDVLLKPGQSLLATGDGEVVRIGSDPKGFGPDYPIIKWFSGPEAGKTTYYGHTDAVGLRAGQRVKQGQVVARTSKTGHNAPPGWLEYGYAPGGTPGPFGQPTPF